MSPQENYNYEKKIEDLNTEATALNIQIDALSKDNTKKNNKIRELQSQLTEKDQIIHEQTNELHTLSCKPSVSDSQKVHNLEHDIRSLRVQLCDAKDRIDRMAKESAKLSCQLTEKVRIIQDKNKELQSLASQTAAGVSDAELKSQLTEKDKEIEFLKNDLQSVKGELDDARARWDVHHKRHCRNNQELRIVNNKLTAQLTEIQGQFKTAMAEVYKLKSEQGSAAVLGSPNNQFEEELMKDLDSIGAMLIQKNRSYGNSALDPVRIFSKASPTEQIRVRIDDKLSRLQRGAEFGNEDTIRDLIGYFFLFLQAQRAVSQVKQECKSGTEPKNDQDKYRCLLGYQASTGIPIYAYKDHNSGKLYNIEVGDGADLRELS